MMHDKAKAMLQEKNLKLTITRLEILSFFIHNSTGHSLNSIQQSFSAIFDRVTIYRTLNTFVDMGFLTKTISTSGSSYYLFHSSPTEVHPHLKCKYCDSILCLPALPDKYKVQLKSFEIEAIPILLEGVCDDCANEQPISQGD